jgi:glucose/mannose-6-phosphate isomerase
MDLNATLDFPRIDQSGMYASILEMPEQLLSAYALGNQFSFPASPTFKAVIIAGMGGSAIAADLLVGCYSDVLPLPVSINRDYHLPRWVEGKDHLVICSSHSGNTEETLSAFEDAQARHCTIFALTTGGNLAQRARKAGVGLWQFDHQGQPRAAVGWSFGMLLALFEQLAFLPSQREPVETAVRAMRELIARNAAVIPSAQNPAKRLAGQLVGEYVAVFGAEHLTPVARRWKTQVNELAKAWCQFEALPEADHNTLAGILNPEERLLQVFSIFLQSPHYHPRNQERVDLTFTELMVAGIGTDKIGLRGESRFTDQWLHVLFGDLAAYYLALLYDVDPTPVEAIDSLKARLG